MRPGVDPTSQLISCRAIDGSSGNHQREKEILPAAGETSAYPRPKPGTAVVSGPGGHGPGLGGVGGREGGGAPAQRWRHWWVAGGAATGFLGY